jgi:tetratricopeptide (TPR) repeat protein
MKCVADKKTFAVFLVSLTLGAILSSLLTLGGLRWVQEGSAFYLMFSGLDFKKSGDSVEAMQCFYYASALMPKWYTPHIELGLIYEEKGHLDLALQGYQQALHWAVRAEEQTGFVRFEQGRGAASDVRRLSAKIRELSDKLGK